LRFWGLVLTPNFRPHARMDLLDWFFSFQLLITLTSAYDTIT
jgi:hypothetical protein